MFLIT
jgi:sporulation protein YlmC with PRC-barrel domain